MLFEQQPHYIPAHRKALEGSRAQGLVGISRLEAEQ